MGKNRLCIEVVLPVEVQPHGRGHLTIKRKILPHLQGWCGGKQKEWHVDDLLTLPDLERAIWIKVNAWMNEREHSTTRRIPNRHYEEEIGARPLGGTGRREVSPEVWLPLLMPADDVVLHDYGFEHGGHRYFHESFSSLMNGRTVRIYHDPSRPRFVHVALPGPDGKLRYLGNAERYTHPESPPPAAWVQAQEEAHWREEQERLSANRERIRVAEKRMDFARVAGEADALRLAATSEIALIASGSPMLALPPSTEGAAAEVEPGPARSAPEPAAPDAAPPAAGPLSAAAPAKRQPRPAPKGGTSDEPLCCVRESAPLLINPFEE